MIIYKVELYDSQGLAEAIGGIVSLNELYDRMRALMRTAEDSPNLHVLRVYTGDEITSSWVQNSDREWEPSFDLTRLLDK